MSKNELNKARFLPVLSDDLTDAGILEEEAVYLDYIINGSPLRSLLVLKILIKPKLLEY